MPTTMLVDHIDRHRDRLVVEPIRAVLEDTGVQIAPEQLPRRQDQTVVSTERA